MRILIVEDERHLAEALGQIMTEQRYQTDVVYDGADGLDYSLTGQYDVIVLDVMLPKVDGLEVAQRLRAAHVSTPILMLTARDEVADKISGLDCGADDYMTKPFDAGELLARIRALTRRQGQGEPPAPQGLAFADLRLDPSARSLHREGKSVQLSPKEFELLRLLMGRAGAVCPKGEILDRLWGGAEDNNLEAYISFLRKKFFYLGSRASIATLRKVGYRLDDPDRPA